MTWFLLGWLVLSCVVAVALGSIVRPEAVPATRSDDRSDPPSAAAEVPPPDAARECNAEQDFDRALASLERRGPFVARVALLRWFAGLTVPEIAALLGIDEAAVEENLVIARSV
jgi:DNA-directed RNA polymerase specialized sigma24 family protein